MDVSKLLINYSEKIKFINEKSDFIPILESQSSNFLQIMKIRVKFSSLISFGKIFIENGFSIKNKRKKILILYKNASIKDYFRIVVNIKYNEDIKKIITLLKGKNIYDIFNINEYKIDAITLDEIQKEEDEKRKEEKKRKEEEKKRKEEEKRRKEKEKKRKEKE